MEAIENSDLNINQKMELLRERCEGFIAVCDSLKEIIDSDCSVSWLSSTLINAVIVNLTALSSVDDILVSSKSN